MRSGSRLNGCDLAALATQCPLTLDGSALAYGMPLGDCLNESVHWRGLLALDASLRVDWAKAIARAANKDSEAVAPKLPHRTPLAVITAGGSKVRCRTCSNLTVKPEDSVFCGGCPGSLYCESCMIEIDATTGKPALLCGACEACKSLVADGLFNRIQKRRMASRTPNQPGKEE